MSGDFTGTRRMSQIGLWLPGASYPILTHSTGPRYDDRGTGGYYEFVARLEEGATWEQAEAELQIHTGWLREQYPEENAKFDTAGFQRTGMINSIGREQLLRLFGLMMGASALVLLIACSNVASLLLIRGVARREEIAIRRALGAGRWRVLRQHIAEGMVLWGIAGAVGVLFVWALTKAVPAAAPFALGIPQLEVPLDWRPIAFAAALSLSVGLMFSVIPALRALRVDVMTTFQRGEPNSPGSRFSTGSVLTVVQLSASMALVVGALLLVSTMRNLTDVDLGFDTEGLTMFRLEPRSAGYGDAAASAYYREFAERLREQPTVQSVALSRETPYFGSKYNHAC